jgi:hypothetical protein
MEQLEQFRATLATYLRHGWQLRRVLMRPATLAALRAAVGNADETDTVQFEQVNVQPAAFDAMWFARPSHGGREAWELRLASEPPYALFELFEPDELEADREDVRREMEARMKEKMNAA